MRRPWIKVETATPDKPEICAIASRLRMDEDMVVGKLVRLWSWVALNRVDGSDLGVTLEFIDKLVSRKGFSAALCHAGWLIENDGKLSLPNFDRHNSDLAKTRALTSQRVARHRVAKNLEPTEDNTSVTISIPTPTLEEVELDTPVSQVEESNATTGEALETGFEKTDSANSDEETSADESEDLENVLSINAIPTFKPLHSESALAEAMSSETPITIDEPEVTSPAPLAQEHPEPAPVKKSRRKAESETEGQPMLF